MNVDISFFILPFLLFPFRYYLVQSKWQSLLLGFSLLVIAYHSIWAMVIAVLLSFLVFVVIKKFQKFKWITLIVIVLGFIFLKSGLSGILLLGYAYYSLQLISILIIPSKKVHFFDILLGTVFFPRFFSGPILKHNQIILTSDINKDLKEGSLRLVLGLCKIFILSNRLDFMISGYFEHSAEINNGLLALLSSLLFTIQMYLNFSGFTDIAIGLARVLGVELPENFDLPLRSKNISEYWRKTHITLINWFTQFVFYPIVYKFKSVPKFALVLGIFSVFILSALWHNFQFGFIVWGLLNAFFIVLEYFIKSVNKIPRFLGFLYVLFVVTFSNFFFKLGDLQNIRQSLKTIYQVNFLPQNFMADVVAILGKGGYLEQQYHLLETLVLLLLFLLFEKSINRWFKSNNYPLLLIFTGLYLLFIFGNFAQNNQFIYLQF
jgi:alginate O-acetyltransferase complex protein AlgI